MADQKRGKELATIGGSAEHPVYRFTEQDANYIRVDNLEDPKQYIYIDKQALLIFAKTFKELGEEFTV